MDELIKILAEAPEPTGQIDEAVYLALRPVSDVVEFRALYDTDPRAYWFWMSRTDYTSSVDKALSLLSHTLPGWMWRLASCSVSDDAWVCPDFNHPKFGAEFNARFAGAFNGRDPTEAIIDATDVDRRPAGNPAIALVLSTLLGVQLLRSIRMPAPVSALIGE